MTTSVAQKLNQRNAANKLKFGSPKLRDLLRHKCRVRMKESRGNSYDASRLFENNFMSRIVKEELQQMDMDIELQEQIYAEIEEDMLQWTFAELEQENNYLFNDKPTFFCPFCRKSELIVVPAIVEQMLCQTCHIQFKCHGTPDQFHELIQRRLVQHELLCDENIEFFTEPISSNFEIYGLNAICMKCDFYSSFY
ncbi:RIP-like protein [Pseudolycoriella hygida]|uniref:RIP-like protein n=1 Tax=Pseudolycoriella hygida TaxID=35572 RepID=A0A9Q0RVD3_9DIPT|nr:RIP-like protein [Pseudolycoriella hygida]